LLRRLVSLWIRETEDREKQNETNQTQFSHVNIL
jgi:hypothetical protein